MYLITGAAGFIGSTLLERLLRDGKKVRGVDCFTDYYDIDIKKQNIKASLNNKNFELAEADLAVTDITALLDGVDVVFHLAAQPGVRKSWGKDFQIYTDQNIKATQRLLEAMEEKKIKMAVYASSSSVYGEIDQLPMHEELFIQPVSPYGVTKLAAENLFLLYNKAFNLPSVSLRLFTVYGPRQRPDMAFNKFMQKTLKEETIEIFGDGEQTRDFTYVDDVVDAFIAASERGIPGTVYNVGGGHRISVNKLLKMMKRVTGRNLKIKHIPAQKGEMTHTYADCRKAKRDLGYTPKFDLEKGLANEWEWIKQNRGNNNDK